MVLSLLQANNLRAKLKKCDFYKSELKYLGHLISANGMRPEAKKVQVIQDWPTPKDVYEVRSFLGLANYFCKYIKGYASLAAPLTELFKGLAGTQRSLQRLEQIVSSGTRQSTRVVRSSLAMFPTRRICRLKTSVNYSTCLIFFLNL
jgi:hypothetical protein